MILLWALAVRVPLLTATFVVPSLAFTGDSHDYWGLARQLVSEGRFGNSARPEIFRTPGYPLFLTPGVLWDQWVGYPSGTALMLLVQMLLDVGLVWLTYRLAMRLTGRPAVALGAAALAGFSPLAAAASCRVLSDSLFAVLLTAAVLLASEILRRSRAHAGPEQTMLPPAQRGDEQPASPARWLAMVLGLLLVAACYVRPVGMTMAGILIAGLAAAGLRAGLRRKRLWAAAIAAAVVVVGICPWILRNGLRADYWGFSDFSTQGLYVYSTPRVIAASEGVTPQVAWDRMMDDFATGYTPVDGPANVGELSRYRYRYARQVIAGQPGTYARLHLKGDLAFWLPGATDAMEVIGVTEGHKGTLAVFQQRGLMAAVRHYFEDRPAVAIAGVILAVPDILRLIGLVLCVLWGLRRCLAMPAGGWLCVLLVLFAALAAGPAAHPRFRVPVEPILDLAAAIGWAWLFGMFRRSSRRDTPECATKPPGTA